MSSIELTSASEDHPQGAGRPLHAARGGDQGEDIAGEVDRNAGTIRNQMQSLKALQLVEGVPGPKGGYKPTANAYEALEIQQLDTTAEIPVFCEGEEFENANVQEIDLTSVHHPELCRAEIHLRGSVKEFHEGDELRVGPTPLSKLLITGTLDGKDDTSNILILKIDSMEAPAEEPAH